MKNINIIVCAFKFKSLLVSWNRNEGKVTVNIRIFYFSLELMILKSHL